MASRKRMKGGEIKYTMSVDDLKKLITKRARCGTYGYITTYKCNDPEINAMDNDIKTTVENMITNYEYNDVENVIDLPQFQTIFTLLKTISFKKETYEDLIEQLKEYIIEKTKYDKLYIEKTNDILRNLNECAHSGRCIFGANPKHYNVTVKTINALLKSEDVEYLKKKISEAVNAALVEPTFMPPVNDANDANTSVGVNNDPDNLTPSTKLLEIEKNYNDLTSTEKTTFQNETGLIPAPAAGGSRRKQSKRRKGKQSKRRKGKQSKRRKHSKRRKQSKRRK
jgi:uncharacterized Fe-S cluster protein YjdI